MGNGLYVHARNGLTCTNNGRTLSDNFCMETTKTSTTTWVAPTTMNNIETC